MPGVDKVVQLSMLGGKFILLIFFLIMALINGHKEYISTHPRKFVWDGIAIGGLSGLAFFIIGSMRKIPMSARFTLAFLSFLVFFVYSVLREMAGANAVTDPSKLTQGEAKQVKALKEPITYMFIIVAGLLFIAAIANRFTTANTSVFQPLSQLAIEAGILGLLTGVSEAVVAWNHDEDTKTIGLTTVFYFVMFFVLHFLLEYSGFYGHVFVPEVSGANVKNKTN